MEFDMFDALPRSTRRLPLALAVSVMFGAVTTAFADGNFDPTFGDGGRLLIDVSPGHSDVAKRFILTPAGKLLMGGTCVGTNGANTFTAFCVTQLLPDGSYDGNFGPGGVGYVRFDHFAGLPNNTSLSDMIVLRDGRIALLGVPTDTTQMLLAVLLADGTALDSSVGSGSGYLQLQFGGRSSTPESLVQQADGKILIAGEAIGANGNSDFAAARLRVDLGGFDTAFASGGAQTVAFDLGGPSGDNTDLCEAVRMQSDGKIVLAGFSVTSPAGQPPSGFQASLTRLNADGSRDLSFGSTGDGRIHYLAGGIAAAAEDARIDAGDHIVLGGVVSDGTNVRWLIDRLSRDGARDPNFNGGNPLEFLQPPGDGGAPNVRLALTNDGIFAVGDTPRTSSTQQINYFAVAHINWNGSLDASFGNGGRTYGSFTSTNDSDTTGIDVAVGNGGLMVAGTQTQSTSNGYDEVQFGIGRLQYDQIFRYGFD
jgi:uncharacterized delta-60 repeat protein